MAANWYPNNTNFATSYLTAQHEKQATTVGTNSPVSLSWNVPANTSNGNFATFSGNAAAHSSADWSANTGYGYSIEVTAIGGTSTLNIFAIRFSSDLSSARVVNNPVVFMQLGSTFGTGIVADSNINLSLWNSTPNFNADATRSASDVISLYLRASNSNMMAAETLTINIVDTDTFLIHPDTDLTQTVSCNVINTSSTIPAQHIIPVRDFNTDEWYFTDTAASITGGNAIQKAISSTATPTDVHSNLHTDPVISSSPKNTHSYRTAGDGPGTLDWPTSDWYIGLEIFTTADFDTFDVNITRLNPDNFNRYNELNVVTDQTIGPGYTVLEFGPFTWSTVNNHSGRSTSDNILVDIDGVTQTTGTTQNFSVVWDITNSYVSVVSSTPTIVCPVITASSSLFNPTIINTQEINLNVLNATSTVLSPNIQQTSFINFNVLNATSTVNAPSVVLRLFAPVINAPETVFTPNIVAKILMDAITASSTLFNVSVLHRPTIEFQTITVDSTLFSPTVNSDIALNVVNSTTTVFNPSLDYDVVLPVINAPDNVLQPATDTSVNIELLFVADDSTIFDPTLNQDVALDVYNAPATVPNPQASNSGSLQDIQLVLVNAASTVLNPSVTTLTTVIAQVLDSPSTVFSPSLKHDVILPVVTTVSTIFSPSLEQIVEMQLVNTAPSVLAPRIGEEADDGFSGAIVKGPDTSPFPIGIR